MERTSDGCSVPFFQGFCSKFTLTFKGNRILAARNPGDFTLNSAHPDFEYRLSIPQRHFLLLSPSPCLPLSSFPNITRSRVKVSAIPSSVWRQRGVSRV